MTRPLVRRRTEIRGEPPMPWDPSRRRRGAIWALPTPAPPPPPTGPAGHDGKPHHRNNSHSTGRTNTTSPAPLKPTPPTTVPAARKPRQNHHIPGTPICVHARQHLLLHGDHLQRRAPHRPTSNVSPRPESDNGNLPAGPSEPSKLHHSCVVTRVGAGRPLSTASTLSSASMPMQSASRSSRRPERDDHQAGPRPQTGLTTPVYLRRCHDTYSIGRFRNIQAGVIPSWQSAVALV